MKKTKVLSLLLSCSMVAMTLPMVASAENASYSDTTGHWAEASIDRWSEYGIIQGNEGKFEPDSSITRGQMATILSNALGLTQVGINPFSDVANDAWYTPYVLRCYAAGIIQGDNGKANPDATITRQEAMVMLVRALGIKPIANPDLSKYADMGDMGDWAAPYVAAMIEKGIVNGVSDTQLAPIASMTRASVMTILDRAVVQYINTPGSYELSSQDGIVLVASGDVTLTGTTSANILITQAATGKKVTFDNATVTGNVTVTAENTKVINNNSKLPEITVINNENNVATPAPTTAPTPAPTTAPTSTPTPTKRPSSGGSGSGSSGNTSTGERLSRFLAAAQAYTYDDYTYVGDIAIDVDKKNSSATIDGQYTVSNFNPGAMNDTARFLGALYRANGGLVSTLRYNGVIYTWDSEGTLLGSNWKNADGATLVSVIVDDSQTGVTSFEIEVVGFGTITLKISLFASILDNAVDYVYPDESPYEYVVAVEPVIDGDTAVINGVYTTENFNPGAMNDTARFLGALYRANGGIVSKLAYKDVEYTWDAEGTLKGSNWKNADGNTLVSVIVNDSQTGVTSFEIEVVGFGTITLKISLFASILDNAVNYVYPDESPYEYVVAVEPVIDGDTAVINGVYTTENFNPGAMNDTARFLGALYRANGGIVSTLRYNSVSYTWDSEGTLLGSNWKNADGNTLVSVIVNDSQTGVTSFEIEVVGFGTITLSITVEDASEEDISGEDTPEEAE